MAQAMQAVQTSGKIPFRYGSRRRIQYVGKIPFQEGGIGSLQLPNVGYLAGLFLVWTGGIIGSSGPKVNGPWDAIKRLRLNLNLGSASIVDVSGYGLYLVNLFNGLDTSAVYFYNATSRWTYYVPVSANLNENFSTGLILLQDPQIRATLEVQCNILENAFNGSNVTASGDARLEVYYVYWEVPEPSRVSQPPLVLHRIIEETLPIVSTGENVYLVPRQGILLQLYHSLILNGNYSFMWSDAYIRLNRVDTIAKVIPDIPAALNLMGRTVPQPGKYPTHVIPWDFFQAGPVVNTGDLRDALDTEAVTTIESVVTIKSDAQLGNGNNFLGTIRRILQPIQP